MKITVPTIIEDNSITGVQYGTKEIHLPAKTIHCARAYNAKQLNAKNA